MLKDPLQFVIGAVAKKEYDENLCHLEIKEGRIIAYGGRISMSTPVDEIKFSVRPHAKSLVKAVQACKIDEEFKLHVTPAGKLAIKAGKFRAYVNCLSQEKEMPMLLPQGQFHKVTEEFVESIVKLEPFMSVDASRPWAQGLRIGKSTTSVTNNIILAQHWHGADFPMDCIIPADAVHELIRIDDAPVGVQFNEHSLTFYFSDGRWLCTQLIAQDGGWGNADKIFEQNTNMDGLQPIEDELYDAIDKLKNLLGERGLIYLKGDYIATSPNDEEGASIEVPVPDGPIFHAAQFKSLRQIATKINLSTYPKPCYFIGNKLRGIIVGVRE